ncbi:MAG: PmoA family protein [Pirellulales bacterium]
MKIIALVVLCLAIAASGSRIALPGADAAEITVEKSEHGAAVKIDGKLFTEYVTRSGTKPILWPVIGPTGKAMTRSWPMNADAPPSEKRDHPHHRSFWFTHGEVNGVDFWSESNKAGRIVHREFAKIESKPTPTIVAINDWQDREGKKICEERQTIAFGADDDRRWIDFTTAVTATEGPLTFGDTKEGSFGVRVAGTMKVDAKLGGKIVNSEGQTNDGAWGKPAAWVDYYGPVEGETLGIAILDHPSNFRHPTTWHVRTYGLFAANPFGQHDFAGGDKNVDGKHTIGKGETLTLRYRVLLHKGDEKQGRVAEAFEAFKK